MPQTTPGCILWRVNLRWISTNAPWSIIMFSSSASANGYFGMEVAWSKCCNLWLCDSKWNSASGPSSLKQNNNHLVSVLGNPGGEEMKDSGNKENVCGLDVRQPYSQGITSNENIWKVHLGWAETYSPLVNIFPSNNLVRRRRKKEKIKKRIITLASRLFSDGIWLEVNCII